MLAALAVVALAATGAIAYSQASYTTTSETRATASALGINGWLHLYSQGTDPVGLGGYATYRTGRVRTLCATGSDTSLVLVMGRIRAGGTSTTFNRTFTIQAPAALPDTSVASVTVTATYGADPTSGRQPIRDCRFTAVANNPPAGSASVALIAGQKLQANIRLQATGTGWVSGRTYQPTLLLTLAYGGGPLAYYVYTIPMSVTIR